MKNKILNIFKNPRMILWHFCFIGWFNWLNDEKYIKLAYRLLLDKKLDLKNPSTFNEKMQWLKLKQHDEIYTLLVDKDRVKNVVLDKIGKQYLIPTIGVYDNFDDINFDKLPNSFVIKSTHDSGGIVLCKNKDVFDKIKAKKIINKSLKRNFYYMGREYPYKNVKPRILIEEYLENGKEGLHDYKTWCFNGKVKYIQYISGRMGDTTEAFYDTDWNKQRFSYHNPLMKEDIKRPENLQELINVAEQLAKGHPFMRADFYILNDNSIKFGECTFYPMAGFETWKPNEMDKKFGDMIDLTLLNK